MTGAIAGLGGLAGFTGTAALVKTVYRLTLTSAANQTWPVPSNFNPLDNTIEVISHSASGGDGTYVEDDPDHHTITDGAGGASGGYAKAVNVALTPGGTMTYRLREADAGSGDAGASWANGATLAASSAGIRGQAGGTTNATGTVKTNGNTGFASTGGVPPTPVPTLDSAAGNSAGYGGNGGTGAEVFNPVVAGSPGQAAMIVITDNASM